MNAPDPTPAVSSPEGDGGLREQIAELLDERIGDNSDLYATVDDVLRLVDHAHGGLAARGAVLRSERDALARDVERLAERRVALQRDYARAWEALYPVVRWPVDQTVHSGLPGVAQRAADEIRNLRSEAGHLTGANAALSARVTELVAQVRARDAEIERLTVERDLLDVALQDSRKVAATYRHLRELERAERAVSRPIPDDAAEQVATLLHQHQRTTGMAVTMGWTCRCGHWAPGSRPGERAEDHHAALVLDLVRGWLSTPATVPAPARPPLCSTLPRGMECPGRPGVECAGCTLPAVAQAPAGPTAIPDDVAEIRAAQIAALTSQDAPRVDCSVRAPLTDGQIRRLLLEIRNLKAEGHHAGHTLEMLLDPKLGELLDDITEFGPLLAAREDAAHPEHDLATPADFAAPSTKEQTPRG